MLPPLSGLLGALFSYTCHCVSISKSQEFWVEGGCLSSSCGRDFEGNGLSYRLLKFSNEIPKTEKVVGIHLSPSTKPAGKTLLEECPQSNAKYGLGRWLIQSTACGISMRTCTESSEPTFFFLNPGIVVCYMWCACHLSPWMVETCGFLDFAGHPGKSNWEALN